MIESQRGEAACFTSFCFQTATNKQLKTSRRNRQHAYKKHMRTPLCLWLTDEMFNISIRSWFPLWLPPGTSDVLKWQLYYYLFYPTLFFFVWNNFSFYLLHHADLWLPVSLFDICGCGVWPGSIPGVRVFILICGDGLPRGLSDCVLGFK